MHIAKKIQWLKILAFSIKTFETKIVAGQSLQFPKMDSKTEFKVFRATVFINIKEKLLPYHNVNITKKSCTTCVTLVHKSFDLAQLLIFVFQNLKKKCFVLKIFRF